MIKKIKVKLIRSFYGKIRKHQNCVKGLGLRHIHEIVEVKDTPESRGMLNKVRYMVSISEG